MGKLLLLILVFFSVASIAQSKMKFKDAKMNFGFVKKGEKVVLQYEFTNEGNQPLVIIDAKVECSCTTVKWPKEPIAPGQKGIMEVTFDTTPTYDRQDRVVEIISNSPDSPDKIRFKGVVLKK
ncbi:MAG TPA: DUF1573 domain-containing protein [Bacteroidia bacterium]|jgi:hypothetical protein|nr:DUF1573 domain-containing protein [Bacteroidia bacterium]